MLPVLVSTSLKLKKNCLNADYRLAAMCPNMQPCLSQQTKEISKMVFCCKRQKEQSFPSFPFLPSPMADMCC